MKLDMTKLTCAHPEQAWTQSVNDAEYAETLVAFLLLIGAESRYNGGNIGTTSSTGVHTTIMQRTAYSHAWRIHVNKYKVFVNRRSMEMRDET